MNLFQRQYKISQLSLYLEDFITDDLNITTIFEYVPVSTIANFISRFALNESTEHTPKIQCLIAMAHCAERLPERRNDVENLTLFIIKTASVQFPQLLPILNKVPNTEKHSNMIGQQTNSLY
ncbi:hypothetical protein [Shewanella sediminis]|uniref:hypothetical protein n=1 Tax=Shewanella sediminis TaxID=271097 RepID=UPI00059BCADE|nr:hypothetical protein [Shewanella sediminis]